MELFKGVAKGYTKYRVEYSEQTVKAIAARVRAGYNSHLLDLGCGDGRLTLPLSKYFKQVVAVDISAEMIEEGKRRSDESGINNINWVVKDANDLNENIGRFDCITIAQALHWFNIEKVVSLSYEILRPHGAIAIIGGRSIWSSAPTDWEKKTLEVIKKYLGPERRTVNGKFQLPSKSYDDYFKEAGFIGIDKFEYAMSKGCKTANEVLAEQFTTSYAAKELFGDKLNDFKQELKKELLQIHPDNKFISELSGSIIVGFKG